MDGNIMYCMRTTASNSTSSTQYTEYNVLHCTADIEDRSIIDSTPHSVILRDAAAMQCYPMQSWTELCEEWYNSSLIQLLGTVMHILLQKRTCVYS